MKKTIPNGTEVLIISESNVGKFKKGKIISSKESDDLSYHGSPWYETIYTVQDESGEEYTATYGRAVSGAAYSAIRTVEDHVEKIKFKIENNEEIIEKTQSENNLLHEKIKELLGEEADDAQENSSLSDFQCPKGKTAFT